MELEAIILIVAIVLDTVLGDPRKLPHLIVGYGKLIIVGERNLNRQENRFVKGMVLTIILVALAFAVPFYLIAWFQENDWVEINVVFSSILLFYCLANKTLVKEGKEVFKALKKGGVEAGRKRLSWIVGRDTTTLDDQSIKRATFETLSENLSDGVIAPLFFFACLGVPGAMAYKMINTLDSMIGYKNERYKEFGEFTARLDDIANFIPARITALLMLLVTFRLNGIPFLFNEGKKHSSPNAGYPEAALAFILNCRFGGPNFYGGKLVDKPYIGFNDREIQLKEINKVSLINYTVTFTAVVIIGIVFLWKYIWWIQ